MSVHAASMARRNRRQSAGEVTAEEKSRAVEMDGSRTRGVLLGGRGDGLARAPCGALEKREKVLY